MRNDEIRNYNKQTYSGGSIDFSNNLNYNMTKNEREFCDMSFVGIIRCKDGTLGFADKKSTLNNGEEIGRVCKKIFKNNKFLLTTSGNNMCGTRWLEDVIEELILPDDRLEDFFKKFDSYQKENFGLNDYLFEAYVFENKTLWRVYVKYTINFFQNAQVVYSGDDEFVQALNSKTAELKKNDETEYKHIQMNITCEEMKEVITTLVEEQIKFFENSNRYCSVGKDIEYIVCE